MGQAIFAFYSPAKFEELEYEGMIVAEHCKEGDLVVNLQKSKQLTNVRSSGTDRWLKREVTDQQSATIRS